MIVTKTRRILAVCFALALCSSLALAADGPPPGYEAGNFVRRLAQVGFADLAEIQLKKFEADANLPAAEKASLTTARVEIALERAKRAQTPQEKKDILMEAFSAAQLYAIQKQGTKEGADAQDALDAVATELSEAMVQAVQGEANPSKTAELREESMQFLTKEFNRNDEDKRELEKKETRTPDEDAALLNKSYALPRILLQQARLLDSKAPEKPVKLNDAIDELKKFQLDFSGTGLSFHSLILMGLTYKELASTDKELGKTDEATKTFEEAVGAFNDAISAKEEYKDDNGNYVLDDTGREIVTLGTMEKAKLLSELGRPQEAIAAIDELLQVAPELKTERQGLNAQLIKLEALKVLGKNEEMVKLANKIAESDRGGSIGSRAQEILSKAVAQGGASVDASMLTKAGDRAYKNGDFAEAFAIYRKALRAASDPKARAKLLWQMGSCQSQLQNMEEAAVAYDAAAMASTAEESANAAYNLAVAYSKLSGKSRTPFYQKRYDTSLQLLSQRFPDSALSQNAQYLRGKKLEDEGKIEEAANAYLQVPEKASKYEGALLQAGDCYVQISSDPKLKPEDKQAALVKAEKALTQCLQRLADKREATKNLDENQLNVDYGARKLLASLYLASKPPRVTEVNKLLDSVDRDFANDPAKLAGAKVLTVRAMIFDGRLGEAATLLGELIQRAPKDGGVIETSRNLAIAIDEALDKGKWKDAKMSEDAARLACAQCYRHFAVQQANDRRDRRRVEEAADRIYVTALKIASIPEKDDTFARLRPYKIANTAPFDWALDAYRAIEENETDAEHKLFLNLKIGRACGLLHRYDGVLEAYSAVFADEPVINVLTKALDQEVVKRRPVLIVAALEQAFADVQLSLSAGGPVRNRLCGEALDWLHALRSALRLSNSPSAADRGDDQLFWIARMLEIEALVTRGQSNDYQTADATVNEIKRNYPELDGGKYGAKEKLAELEKELAKRLGQPTDKPK